MQLPKGISKRSILIDVIKLFIKEYHIKIRELFS